MASSKPVDPEGASYILPGTGLKQSSETLSDVSEPKAGVKHLAYNVLFPSGQEQIYYPMLDFSLGGKQSNELDLVRLAMLQDQQDPNRRVTAFYFLSPPGLGKTVLGAHLAKELKCPYQIINCVSTMTDLDLLGSHVLIGQETIWQDGPLPAIIRATNEHGVGILIINELNALTLTAQIGLNPLFDKQHCVVLTLNNNEVVRLNEGVHLLVIASMNPDILGVNELQDAIRDRSNAVIYMNYPTVDKEAWLVSKLTGLPDTITRQFTSVIYECRQLKLRDYQITKAPSTRGLLDWINYSSVWGTEVAFELAVVNRYGTTEEERNALRVIGKGKAISNIKIPKPYESKKEMGVESIPKQVGKSTQLSRIAYAMYITEGKSKSEIAQAIKRSARTVTRYINIEKQYHGEPDSS